MIGRAPVFDTGAISIITTFELFKFGIFLAPTPFHFVKQIF